MGVRHSSVPVVSGRSPPALISGVRGGGWEGPPPPPFNPVTRHEPSERRLPAHGATRREPYTAQPCLLGRQSAVGSGAHGPFLSTFPRRLKSGGGPHWTLPKRIITEGPP